METKKKFLSLSASVLLCGGMFVGCGGGGSTDGGETESGVTYSGTRTLSGTFETFSDTSRSVSRSLRATEGNEIVKLYVLDDKGEMKDTNITCPVTDNAYTCSNIAGNKEYIVRYLKEVSDGKVLEMKSNITVADSDITGVKVDRVSTLIVESISKAVEEALVGVALDESKIAELIASVKTAIKTSIASLVTQGLITIPSQDDMVVTLKSGETFESLKGTVQQNKNLDDSSSVVLANDTVSNTLNAKKNERKALAYASMTNKELVKEIFLQTGDGEVPDWVVDFLGDKYASMPATYTIGNFLNKLNFEEGDDEQARKLFQEHSLNIATIVGSINAAVKNNVATTKLKETLVNHYTLKAKSNKTDDDFKKLAEFPPVLEYLFPESFASSITYNTKLNNMGQGIALVMFAEEVLVQEILKSARDAAHISKDKLSDDMLKNLHVIDFNPSFIFTDLGFEIGSSYDKISIDQLELRTDKNWNNGTETEFLSVYTGIEKPSWMMPNGGQPDSTKLTSATLTYPKANGTTATINLELNSQNSGDDWMELRYSPWQPCSGDDCQPDTSKMDITDYVSGDYTVSVTYDGKTTTKTYKDMFVLKGASGFYSELINPKENPRWPQELNNINWSNMTLEQQAIQDEFSAKQLAYNLEGRTTFALNYDENGDGTNDSVKDVVFKWSDESLLTKIEELDLPANIVPAYQVGINLYNPKDTNGDNVINEQDCNGQDEEGNDVWRQCNTEIFNTWWNNRPIKGTSFTLPIPLKATDENSRYNLNLNVVFIDKTTGRDIGQGGNSWAEFEVGAGTALTGTENIIFTGKVESEGRGTIPAKTKVGLTSESCTFDASTLLQSCTTEILGIASLDSNGNYNLSTAVTDIKQKMTNKGWFNLIAFEDKDDDNIWDKWESGSVNTNPEQAWWPNNKHFWFDNWGEFTVNTQEHEEVGNNFNHVSTKVKQGENVNVEGINFKVFTWN